MDDAPQAATQIPAEEQRLLAGVEPRIFGVTVILAALGTIALWAWKGSAWAGGFVVGAALSILSFQWMKSAITAIADAMPATAAGGNAPSRRGAGGAVVRFVLRYALIGITGYVIFRSSVLSLPAFFAGLFVSIAAVLAEVAYQVCRGFHNK